MSRLDKTWRVYSPVCEQKEDRSLIRTCAISSYTFDIMFHIVRTILVLILHVILRTIAAVSKL